VILIGRNKKKIVNSPGGWRNFPLLDDDHVISISIYRGRYANCAAGRRRPMMSNQDKTASAYQNVGSFIYNMASKVT